MYSMEEDYHVAVTFTIPIKVIAKFRSFCKKNEINMSAKVASLIEKSLVGEENQ